MEAPEGQIQITICIEGYPFGAQLFVRKEDFTGLSLEGFTRAFFAPAAAVIYNQMREEFTGICETAPPVLHTEQEFATQKSELTDILRQVQMEAV